MKLEFEPNVSAFPLIENELVDESGIVPEFETILKNGIRSAQEGDRNYARQLLQKALDIEPMSEDAWMWMASISEYPEELLAALNHVLAINPSNEKASEWKSATCALLAKTFANRAALAVEDGSFAVAEQAIEQALEHDDKCVHALLLKAILSKDHAVAAEYLQAVLDIEPENEQALAEMAALQRARASAALEEAKYAAKNGEVDKALKILDEFLATVPDSSEGWILRSHLSPAFDEKLSSLETALEIDPQNEAARTSYDFLLATFESVNEREEMEATADDSEPVDADPATPIAETEGQEDDLTTPLPNIEGIDAVDPLTLPTDESMEITDAEDPEFAGLSVEFEPDADIHITEEPAVGSLVPEPEMELPSLDSFEPVEAEIAVTEEYEIPAFAPVEEDFDPYKTITLEAPEIEVDEVVAEPEAQASPSEDVPENAVYGSGVSVEASCVCPFCGVDVEVHAVECARCRAALSLSDIESLLSHSPADREVVGQAIIDLEAEWAQRDLDVKELTNLSIGHLILGNYDAGFRCLQEASVREPNNVVLAAQLNTLAIRLDEIKRQIEVNGTKQKGRSIMVVDDSATVRKLISSKLEKSGHFVTCAVDGVDALAKIDETVPDLVLLDISMPNMDGYEVCKQIRMRPNAADVPVIMISGKDGFFDKVRGKMAGTTAYITKPFGPETLMKALEAFLLPANNEDVRDQPVA